MSEKYLGMTLLCALAACVSVAGGGGANPVLRQEGDYYCRKATGMELRGDPGQWRERGALPLFLTKPESVMIPDWKGPDDVEATVYLLHDDAALYFAALVKDGHVYDQENSGQFYYGSGIQLAFDPLDDTLVPGYDGNDIEIGIGKLKSGEDAVHCWVGGEAMSAGKIDGIKVRVSQLGSDLRFYEAAIPWSCLKPFNPVERDVFGFNVLYNASRDGKRRGWVHWTPGVGEAKLAFLFRNVRLVPAGGGSGEAVIGLDKTQYSSGEKALVSVYLPTDKAGAGEAVLTVSEQGREVSREKIEFAAAPGGTVLRYPYHIGRLRGRGLTVLAAVSYPGGNLELSTEIQHLSAAILEEEAGRLSVRNQAFRERLAAAEKNGVAIDYPRVAAAVCDSILKYRCLDLKKPDLIQKFALLPKIRRQFKQLEEILDQAEQDLEAASKQQRPVPRIPQPEMSDITIANGTFYSKGEPVIFIGTLGWGEVYTDIPWVAELGFNMIGGTLIADSVTPAPGKVRKNHAAAIDGHLKTMRRYNLAYDFLPSPHPVPDGWKKAHPEMLEYPTGGWIKSSLYIPATRRMIEAMWSNLLPVVKDNPNLVTLNLVNEWSFSDGVKSIHPEMLAKFRRAMEAKYGNIAALNRKWGVNYGAFGEIDPLNLRRNPPGGIYDYQQFRNQEGLENLRFMRSLAEKYAPGKPCHVKTIAVTDLNPEQHTPVGVERELRGEIMEVAGSDCAGTMELDYYRSVLPSRPASDTEFHISHNTTPDEAVTDCWSAVFHGEGMRLYYTWCPRYSAELLAAGAMLHNPPALAALGKTALDIRRLTPEIVAFQQAIPQAEVALLYSPASYHTDSAYPRILRQCHSILSPLDAQVRFISERQLEADKFERIKLLIIPGAFRLEPASAVALGRFAARGGVIVSIGGKQFSDPYGGAVESFPCNVITASAESFDQALSQAGVTRQVRNASRRPGMPLELRSVTVGDKLLFYAINYGGAIDFRPLRNGVPITEARELISGANIGFPLSLPSRKPMLFMVQL